MRKGMRGKDRIKGIIEGVIEDIRKLTTVVILVMGVVLSSISQVLSDLPCPCST